MIKTCPLSNVVVFVFAVVGVVINFSHCHHLKLDQLRPNLAQSIIRLRGFKFVEMKGHALFQGEIIRIYWNFDDNLKNLLFRNHLARKAKICMKASSDSVILSSFKSLYPGVRWGHNWVKGLHRNILCKSFKIFFLETNQPGKLKLVWKHPYVV